MTDRERTRRVMLRGFALVSGGLALALAVLGFDMGYEVHHVSCFVTSASTAPVASSPLGLLAAMAVVGGLAAYVWRRPLIANALLASLVSIGASGFALALTAPPGTSPRLSTSYDRAEMLPEAALASRLVLALVVVQIVVLPVACGLFALLTRGPERARLARAHVHRIGPR